MDRNDATCRNLVRFPCRRHPHARGSHARWGASKPRQSAICGPLRPILRGKICRVEPTRPRIMHARVNKTCRVGKFCRVDRRGLPSRSQRAPHATARAHACAHTPRHRGAGVPERRNSPLPPNATPRWHCSHAITAPVAVHCPIRRTEMCISRRPEVQIRMFQGQSMRIRAAEREKTSNYSEKPLTNCYVPCMIYSTDRIRHLAGLSLRRAGGGNGPELPTFPLLPPLRRTAAAITPHPRGPSVRADSRRDRRYTSQWRTTRLRTS